MPYIALIALAWLLLFAVVTLVGWTFLLNHLKHRQQLTEQNALTSVAKSAQSYAANLQQTLSAIDQLVLSLKYGWERSEGKLRLEEMFQAGIFISASNFYAAVFDKNGNLISNTVPDSHPLNAATAPFFVQQKDVLADYLYIDKPTFGLFTKRSVLRFSRKLLDRNGSFDGVILISVTLDYFVEDYAAIGLGPHDFLGVIGNDRSVRVTRIGNEVQPAGVAALTSVPGFAAAHGSTTWNGPDWFADARTRYVGWAPIPQYFMTTLVGVDKTDTLTPYRNYRAKAMRNGILATVIFASFTLVAGMLSLRLSWRKHLHEQTQATYRLATESGTEGFYIIEPIRHNEGKLIDFAFIDCNRRGAQLMRTTREHLIGLRMSQLYSGNIPPQMMDLLTLAMERGEHEGEAKLEENSPVAVEWVHFKFVRSDGRLAMALRDISKMKAHVRELERQTNEDPLTGLSNRHWLNNYLPRAVSRARETNSMVATLFIDLDGFKNVNDTVGHDAGDELLRNAARRLKVAVRPGDHVVRMGGDEFIVVIEGIHHRADAAHVAERILHAFHEAFKLSKGTHAIGTSIGISMFPGDGAGAADLVKNSDSAMYAVKTSGKRNYRFYDARFDAALNARHQSEYELRQALEYDQMVMYYQPRIDISSGLTTGMEALVRWAHPTRGIIEPGDFIPLAEETGLIGELGKQVVQKVCCQIALWMRQGQQLVPVSINVSARQFDESDIKELLSASISRYGIDPKLVEIELTESTMSRNSEAITSGLHGIQSLGIRLLVDDFGTGYLSLSQLQRLDFDVLKVGRAFTSKLRQSKEDAALFRAIIAMAHELGMRVVAEGVETTEQAATLSALHCDEIQGFLVSKPVPASDKQPVLPRQFYPSTA